MDSKFNHKPMENLKKKLLPLKLNKSQKRQRRKLLTNQLNKSLKLMMKSRRKMLR